MYWLARLRYLPRRLYGRWKWYSVYRHLPNDQEFKHSASEEGELLGPWA